MSKQSNHKFKAGDVVKLKSGGPHMTVDSYTASGKVVCVWFEDGKSDDKTGTFAEPSIRLVSDESE